MEPDPTHEHPVVVPPGVHALWLAARSLQSDLTAHRVAGLAAAPVRTAACGARCRCAERREALARVPEAAALLGLEARPLRAEEILRGGSWRNFPRPLIWIDARGAGVLRATGGAASLEGIDLDGMVSTAVPSPRDAEGAVVLRLFRHAGSGPGQHDRVTCALLDWVAQGRRPALPGGCPRSPVPCESAAGSAAYAVWLRALGETAPSGREPWADARRARAWQRARQVGAAFLCDLAGAGRSAVGRRLLRAAELLEQEARNVLAPAAERFEGRRSRAEARRILAAGEALFDAALDLVAEAALLRAGARAGMEECLLGDPSWTLRGATLHEVVYLARAGARPFRQLAARRLAGSDAPIAVSTLRELLYDRDPAVAETALWALLRAGAEEACRWLPRAFEALAPSRRPGMALLRRALLVGAVLRDVPEGEAMLEAARTGSGVGGPERRALRMVAARLAAWAAPALTAGRSRNG